MLGASESCSGEEGAQVVAVALVPVDVDVALARVGRDEDERNVAVLGSRVDGREVVVVERPRDDLPSLARVRLQGLERRDEVCVVSRARSPAVGQSAGRAVSVGHRR